MAQLKDTVVQGSLRVTDTTYSTNINLASATASQAVVTDANKNLISKGITDNASSTALGTSDTNLVTARSVANAGYVKSSGVTSVATGAGLTGGTITGTGTIKAYLKSETKATYDSATVTNTSSRQYAITPDKTGYLSVNVPWADTHRVIKVNGTQALASNTTALNLVAGSNVSITDGGSGSVTIAATDTTYSAATTTSAGLMSAADKIALDDIKGNRENLAMWGSLSITIPANTATYWYYNAFITENTWIVATDISYVGLHTAKIDWVTGSGYIMFNLSQALSSSLTFNCAVLIDYVVNVPN